MKARLIVAAIVAGLLGGCVVVPEGHGSHREWHGNGWHGPHGWQREGYHYGHRRW